LKRLASFLALLFLPLMANAGVQEVKLKLPVKPKLQITGDERVAIAPFVIVSPAEKGNHADRAAKVDIQAEFARFLKKQITKTTKLKVIDVGATRLPGSDMKSLEANRDYWRQLGAKTGADFIVSGVIDFDVNDKTGYKTEEYVSPADGRTYYRQVLIETTGFVFDIVIGVFNADTGEKVLEENFRDFKEFDQRNYDELLGMFENLRSLESQLLGIFVSQETSATRYVFTK
jgi:TolB-like protein